MHVPRHVEGAVGRTAPASFDDHFSQPALFYASLTSVEQQHVADAYTFELGKCYEQSIKERGLSVLARIDAKLCAQVAAGLGLPVPKKIKAEKPGMESPALRQIRPTPFPIDGRIVGVVAGPDADLTGIATLRTALEAEGRCSVSSPRTVGSSARARTPRSWSAPSPPAGRSSSTRSWSPTAHPRTGTSAR
ncbi:catalase-related domain-containing protein [Blastococcus brunescens]|uniref:catalase n=1 Tax=Blastococcus brunescens TaxID=1564165 RepID=A0ABZ1B408_9ACTN|nr:catalase-related domain-containing protein [Blastococcus sp. BMG 8361]WRL64896.1 catalase-related domain-containing protein [Blastococcus sp. BMG 8361]